MIVDIPVPYPGEMVPRGARRAGPAALVARVPLEVPDIAASEVETVGVWRNRRAGALEGHHEIRFLRERSTGRLLVPLLLWDVRDGSVVGLGRDDGPAVPQRGPVFATPETVATLGPGGSRCRAMRGLDPERATRAPIHRRPPWPFADPDLWESRELFEDSHFGLWPEGDAGATSREREAFEGARDAALARAREAAMARCASVGGVLHVTSGGPFWRRLAPTSVFHLLPGAAPPGGADVCGVSGTAWGSVAPGFSPRRSWSEAWPAAAADLVAEAMGHREDAPAPWLRPHRAADSFEAIDPGAFPVGRQLRRCLGDSIPAILRDFWYADATSEGGAPLRRAAAGARAWADLADAAAAHVLGEPASEEVCDAAAALWRAIPRDRRDDLAPLWAARAVELSRERGVPMDWGYATSRPEGLAHQTP